MIDHRSYIHNLSSCEISDICFEQYFFFVKYIFIRALTLLTILQLLTIPNKMDTTYELRLPGKIGWGC